MIPARPPVAPEPEPGLVLAAWLALFLALARALVLLGLELAHHGDAGLAGIRLANGLAPVVVASAGIALASALGAWGAGLSRARWARLAVALALFAAALAFLWGRLDADASKRIGLHTALGRAGVGAAAAAALAASAFLFAPRLRRLRAALSRSWLHALPPLALLALAPFALRSAYGRLAPSMDVRRVEHELTGGTWDVLRSHRDAPPRPGLLAPAASYDEELAARPALMLPPPALVRRQLPAAEGSLWLVGGAAVDHSAAEAAGRYPGHSLRVRARVDGATVLDATLPLEGAAPWAELGGGAGVRVAPGALLELESALLDPAGDEVEPADPLLAGLGGLALERRGRVARQRATRERPNVVLVVLDTLRADRTSAYGYARATTPNLDELARRGTLFEESFATASWTWPSTASLLTGLLPEEHGVQDATSSFLAQSLDTLAEALQRAGYTTAAWSGSPLIVPEKHFDQGFEFFDASNEGNMRRSDLVMPGALEWIGTASEWRFFLYLHLMEPHAPYAPLAEGRALFAPDVPTSFDPRKAVDYQWDLLARGFDASGQARPELVVPPEEQRWISDLYDGCVWSADWWLGELLARLAKLDLLENTVVAVTSDHGEELFDHGLLAHAHALHRELVRVPLVIAGPGIPEGERVAAPVSGTAVGPTLARIGGAEIDGREATPDLLRPVEGSSVYFSTRQGYWNGSGRQPLFGVRSGTSVLHLAPRGAPYGSPQSSGDGEVRLYDVAQDPDERVDLAASQPERAREMRDALLAYLAALESRRIDTGGAVDEGTMDVLRGLGYVGGEEEEAGTAGGGGPR